MLNNYRKYKIYMHVVMLSCALCFVIAITAVAQPVKQTSRGAGKNISPDLFGLFFEDINYAADGGLYAELVQNRSFEYSPAEKAGWNPLSYWEYITPGYSYGKISVETTAPLHANNPHYIVLEAEHIGNENKYTGQSGVGIKNTGFAGMVVRAGDKYHLSLFAQQLSDAPIELAVSLQNTKGEALAAITITVASRLWRQYNADFTATAGFDTASLVILAKTAGRFALDVVSLFPEKTFKNRPNGLRADLAQLLADMKPKFVRFPGGCLSHGDGLENMYRWKNTIGGIEERVEQRNIWGYHQTAGLGYYEYFQFCEDIGAKPLPVLAAAVSCQNSGGTWRVGGTGQKAIPLTEMQDYIQEVLDLIEWANGPVNTAWGAKRAAAGHPSPFNLQYIGIGNEDKMTPAFQDRFTMIYDAVKKRYPGITVVGTVGPGQEGEDYEKGWKLANQLSIPVVDEHYYTNPEWFIANQYRYDAYNRKAAAVYVGEYASWGNKLRNAIAEAAYMTSLERNGDIVRLSSYAPLFAKNNFTQWRTDMIFFDNKTAVLTPNYFVQKLFSTNAGDIYFSKVIKKDAADSALAASCVKDSKTGDIILKLVNFGTREKTLNLGLGQFKIKPEAELTVLAGKPEDENTFQNNHQLAPVTTTYKIKKRSDYMVPAMSLTVIRIKTMQ